jgi:predicted nucleic acid-binding protein
MIVVADTSPLNYLVLIEVIDVLAPLYARVVVPRTVCAELMAPGTPEIVRAWMAQPPAWLEIVPDPPPDATLVALDPGDRSGSLPQSAPASDRRGGRSR